MNFYATKFSSISDVSAKQFPRQRRRENNQPDINTKPQTNNNTNGKNRNFYYDKRPQQQQRKIGNNGGGMDQQTNNFNGSTGEASGLMDVNEFNSVFNPGSKKQNLNHLLNFHYYSPKDTSEMHHQAAGAFNKYGYHQRCQSKKYQYNKEQYLQANCQFVVKSNGFDYRKFTISPDALVDWDQVVKVLVSSSEEAQCPICLYPPRAAKMTKCGHIYCFSCMLHYLSLSDKNWRKCPICYESVYLKDLKSTTSKQDHQSYKVGAIITMEIMSRAKGSLYVTKANEIRNTNEHQFPNYAEDSSKFAHSKLIMAGSSEMMNIIQQERNELDFQLIENGSDCPESIFVQQAMDILKIDQAELEKSIIEEADKIEAESKLNPTACEFVPIATEELLAESSVNRNELIDDETNLTLNDIDIIPTASATQSKYFYYYQALNAQNVFLHSVNSRMLQQMYGSLDKSPQTIQGKIVQIESCTMNEDLRKRLKYLQHLPVSSVFEVVEIEFQPEIVSQEVYDVFRGESNNEILGGHLKKSEISVPDELNNRRKIRQKRERHERKREKVINELNDRQMGKMLSGPSVNIDFGSSLHFPECGNYAEMPALPSNVSDRSMSPTLSSSPAGSSSFATVRRCLRQSSDYCIILRNYFRC